MTDTRTPPVHPATQVVQPGPVPMTVNVDTARNGNESLVALQVYTPTGYAIYFLPPDLAKLIGEKLVDESRTASSGIVLPPKGSIFS